MKSSRLVQTGLGIVLVIAGLGGAAWLWLSYRHANETRSWTPVPCLIVSSKVVTERVTPNSPPMHHAEIRYRYSVNDRTYDSQGIKRGLGPSSDPGKPRMLVEKFTAGREVDCFVNPLDPSVSVLEHSSRAAIYAIWFPLLFVGGGTGVIRAALRQKTGQAG